MEGFVCASSMMNVCLVSIFNNYVGPIMDFFGFKAIFITFLIIGNCLSFYLIKHTFFCQFYDNNNVN